MRNLLAIAVVAFAIVAATVTADDAGDYGTHTLKLTDANFESTLADIPIAFVSFTAPWCGACKAARPALAQASDDAFADAELSAAGVRFANIDADAEKKSASQNGVNAFPTLKIFRNGVFADDYDGERTSEKILATLRKAASVAVNREITTLANMRTLTSPKTVTRTTLVGFFTDKTGVDFKIFSSIAAPLASAGIDVYHTATPAVLEGFGFFGGGSSIQLFRPGGKPFKLVFRGTIFKATLRDWVVDNAVPAVGGEYSADTEALYKMTGSPIVRFVADGAAAAVDGALLAKLGEAFPAVKFALSERSQYKADADAQCDAGAPVCVLGHEAAPKGSFKGKKDGEKVFGMPGAAAPTVESVSAFVQQLVARKLKQKIKSQAAPAKAAGAGELVTVVGTTFTELVESNEKAVFLMAAASWCGHCKRALPQVEQLAKDLEDRAGDVSIAMFDADANDMPESARGKFPVSGFPTMFFKPKGRNATPIKYEGGREAGEMKKFILEKL